MLDRLMADARSLLARAVRPTPLHKTRLHTLRGTTMSGREWLDLPVRFAQRLTRARPVEPWLSPSAIRALDRLAHSNARVVEVGAGQSTIWLANRVVEVVSLEPDSAWVAELSQTLAAEQITNVGLEHVQLDDLVDRIDALPADSFDIVVIDTGDDQDPRRGRVRFARHAREKVRPGGVLILDNSDRHGYRDMDDLMQGWEHRRYVGYTIRPLTLIETTFYRRQVPTPPRDRLIRCSAERP